jgi:DNA-binding NarL/FixJ family response regulator
MINIAIVEDEVAIRDAIQNFLNQKGNMKCEQAYGSVEQFIHNVSETNLPDIIMMDIGLPGISGISGIKLIKKKYPRINIIMLTIFSDSYKIFQSLCAGASGYLLKNAPFSEIFQAIEIVYNGGSSMSPQIARKVVDYFQKNKSKSEHSGLTEKEKEIVAGLVDGLSYKKIAEQNFISLETVRTHIKNIYKKLHVHCKVDVIKKSLSGEI